MSKTKMKTLKFRDELVRPILTGQKISTWRLFDDKDIKEGDILEFIAWETNKVFARAEVSAVKEKRFKDLNADDFVGHDKFKTDPDMYKQYSQYYQKDVNENTIIKIIKFHLLKNYE